MPVTSINYFFLRKVSMPWHRLAMNVAADTNMAVWFGLTSTRWKPVSHSLIFIRCSAILSNDIVLSSRHIGLVLIAGKHFGYQILWNSFLRKSRRFLKVVHDYSSTQNDESERHFSLLNNLYFLFNPVFIYNLAQFKCFSWLWKKNEHNWTIFSNVNIFQAQAHPSSYPDSYNHLWLCWICHQYFHQKSIVNRGRERSRRSFAHDQPEHREHT